MTNLRDQRQEDYGCFKQNFKKASEIALSVFNLKISPEEIIEALIAVKFARECNKHKSDNLEDCSEYILMLNELREEKNECDSLYGEGVKDIEKEMEDLVWKCNYCEKEIEKDEFPVCYKCNKNSLAGNISLK